MEKYNYVLIIAGEYGECLFQTLEDAQEFEKELQAYGFETVGIKELWFQMYETLGDNLGVSFL